MPASNVSDASPIHQVSLDDKYTASGRVYASGIQMLVRLPLMQRALDQAAGLNTAGYISGYRGSPLGRYDEALAAARTHLDASHVHFQPALNEDLAATAIWGTQQLGLFPGARYDGVFAIWYGKGPGVDRSTDALKHGNAAGTAAHGGVLLVVGDDHGCQSSTLPHQSEQVLAAAMIPVLNPASVHDYLEFGLYGIALSRFSGCWVAFKAIAETVESSARIDVDLARSRFIKPSLVLPAGGLNIRWPDPAMEQERRLHGPRMAAVAAFARANPIDRIVLDAREPRLGIMATGKAYLDVRQALHDLGIDAHIATELGLRVYKVGITWPLEQAGALRFANGLSQILVVEEKRAFIEDQLVRILYGAATADRPVVAGKRDEHGAALLPSEGELSSLIVARAIVRRLAASGAPVATLEQKLARMEALAATGRTALNVERTPFFCAGCPHNTSTRLPEGSRALAGIGCHGMAMLMPDRRASLGTHMGGEGATWIGQSPFTREQHVFQNLGDGTYQHSGLLALRAASIAGVNITYKILFNDAVAMTGGQPVDGRPTVARIVDQVLAEGAREVAVVAEDAHDYHRRHGLATRVEVRARADLDGVQRRLRDVPGLTVLLYDQTCAAEKRRRRKRGTEPMPAARVMINERVCEGCGDCSARSNCIAVRPVETALGRKRTIDQSSCNRDYSCIEGFCPSFVTVEGLSPRRLAMSEDASGSTLAQDIPVPPAISLSRPFSILITGVGGTGVLTIGALLGMAAHLEGKGCSVLDFTGLAQKNGAVTSEVKLAPSQADLHAARISTGGADLVLACDLVVACAPASLSRISRGTTHVIANADVQPTGAVVLDNDVDMQLDGMKAALQAASGPGRAEFIAATQLATAIGGDAIATNLFMLGYAFQRGYVPLTPGAIERAIELNGVAADENRRMFRSGRRAAQDPAGVASLLPEGSAEAPRTMNVAERAAYLHRYQDADYASRYRERIARVDDLERARAPGCSGLTEAAAEGLFRVMACKDEYEVARLYTDGEFAAQIAQRFEGKPRMTFHLAPALLARRDPHTGRLLKRSFGPWLLPVLRAMAGWRRFRGSALDPFRYTADRRLDRQLRAEYERMLDDITAALSPSNHAIAVELARTPVAQRGFGHVRIANAKAARERADRLLDRFHAASSASAPREQVPVEADS